MDCRKMRSMLAARVVRCLSIVGDCPMTVTDSSRVFCSMVISIVVFWATDTFTPLRITVCMPGISKVIS
jgi:hypothetical protein